MPVSLSGSILITGSLTTSGTITAQTLVVQTITSSIVNMTGSNIFGSVLGDRQTFTGSVVMTGSLTVNTTGTEFQVTSNGVVMGNLLTDRHSVTGSMFITGSIAQTGSNTTSSFTGNVGIGTTTPGGTLEVYNIQNAPTILRINNPSTGSSAHVNLQLGNSSGSNVSGLALFGGGYTNSGLYLADGLYMYNNRARGGITIATEQLTDIVLATNATERLRISSSGAVLQKTGSYTIDSGVSGIAGIIIAPEGTNTNSGFTSIQTFYGSIGYTSPLILNRYGGNVGIGTTTPSSKLHLYDGTNPLSLKIQRTTVPVFFSDVQTAGTTAGAVWSHNIENTSNGSFTWSGLNNTSYAASAIILNSDTATSYITFHTSGSANTAPTERMRITGGGLVGIGTSSPDMNNWGANHTILGLSTDVAGKSSQLNLRGNSNATANVMIGTVSYLDSSGTGAGASLASIDVYSATATSGRPGSHMVFSTNDGSSTAVPAAERMRITSAGNVGINTTSPSVSLHVNGLIYAAKGGSTNNIPAFQVRTGGGGPRIQTYGLDADANAWMGLGTDMAGNPYEHSLYFSNASSGTLGRLTIGSYNGTTYSTKMTVLVDGSIGAPTGTNIYNPSDLRLKKNIVTVTDGLNKIMGLNPVKFNWVENFSPDEQGKDMLGFIAQEVQSVVPEAVESFSDGSSIVVGESTVENPLRVNEKFIIPVLVKAIQELEARVKELENK